MAKKGAFAYVLAPIVGQLSKEARDFAARATDKLAPWIAEHYKVVLRDEGTFSHQNLLEYHLRGDHFIGLTRDDPNYERLGLSITASGSRQRFVNIPSRPLGQMYPLVSTEPELRRALITQPPFVGVGGQTQFTLHPVVAERDAESASDFLIKELINSTSLVHLTMQELGSMTFSLLPFAGTKVYEETMDYILQFVYDVMSSQDGILKVSSDIHPLMQHNSRGAEYLRLANQLSIEPIEVRGTPAALTDADFTFPSSAPLYLVEAAVTELVASGVDLTGDTLTHLQNLFISAFQACKRMRDDGHISQARGEARFNKNKDTFNNVFRPFLKSYFDKLVSKYPLGTIISLASADAKGIPRAVANANVGPTAAEVRNHNEYIITSTRLVKKNKKLQQQYQLTSTLADATEPANKFITEFDGDKGSVFVLSSDPEKRRTVEVSTPAGIIGRAMLTSVIHMAHVASYYVSVRDFRRLSTKDAPGSYRPLPTPGTFGRGSAFTQDKQKSVKQGILDYYVDTRLEFMAAYLAGLYDSVPPSMRDQMRTFYESDMFANEFAYYSSAVSNYISSVSTPEENIEPISGRMSVYRTPENETGIKKRADPYKTTISGSRFLYTQPVAPESVYYQLESPMLRLIYQEYVSAFYDWYVNIARDLDQGRRNFTPAGVDREGTAAEIRRDLGITKKKDPYKKTIQPTQAILKQLWPVLKSRATEAVKDGRAASHEMMRQLAKAANLQRSRLNLATPLVPFSTTFIDFGALLSDPRKYNLPPSLDASVVGDFITYLESVFFTSYELVGALATSIETAQAANLSRDALIAEFQKKYAAFRKTKVVNRFTWPATAELIHLFREFTSIPARERAQLAAEEAEAAIATTTQAPGREENARVEPARTTPVPLAIREEP